MLRLVFFVLLTAAPALADDAALISRYADVRGDCREGQTVEGRELSEEEIVKVCAERDVIGKELTDKGYCWDSGEQTWITCPLTN